ncbi:hypothetical protein [Burkholderia dolosa]
MIGVRRQIEPRGEQAGHDVVDLDVEPLPVYRKREVHDSVPAMKKRRTRA